MGYYLELRPKDRDPLTVEVYKQRFLEIGLEPHPALTHPDEEEEIRKKYVNDVIYSGGTITIIPWKELPCGVTAEARMSWSEDAESASSLIGELLGIADKVNAALYAGDNQLITGNNVQHAAASFMKGKRMSVASFGTADAEKSLGGANRRIDRRALNRKPTVTT